MLICSDVGVAGDAGQVAAVWPVWTHGDAAAGAIFFSSHGWGYCGSHLVSNFLLPWECQNTIGILDQYRLNIDAKWNTIYVIRR